MRTYLGILILLIITSCSTQDSKIQGEWKLKEVYNLGTEKEVGDAGLALTFTIDGDHTFKVVSELKYIPGTGTWDLTDQRMTLVFDDNGGISTFEIESLTDSTLVCSSSFSGTAQRYSLIK